MSRSLSGTFCRASLLGTKTVKGPPVYEIRKCILLRNSLHSNINITKMFNKLCQTSSNNDTVIIIEALTMEKKLTLFKCV